MKQLVIENGHNTDYIIMLLVALFWNQHSDTTKLLETDATNSDAYYIQEFLKYKIVNKLHCGNIIESHILNKLRMFLYTCGWLKQTNKHILTLSSIKDFYDYLFHKMVGYSINFDCFNETENYSETKTVSCIEITSDLTKNLTSKQLNLNKVVELWIDKNITHNKCEFALSANTILFPIFFNLQNATRLNIMKTMVLKSVEKNTLIIHSLVCQASNNSYYAVVPDETIETWFVVSDKTIPSVAKINMADIETVKKLTDEVVCVFYVLHQNHLINMP